MHRTITASELAQNIGTEAEPFVLDVREPDEYAEWRIPGSTNIPVGELVDRLDEIPRDHPVVAHCAAGGRSLQAYEILDRHGFDVVDLEGGMGSWAKVYDTAEVLAGEATVVQVRRRAKGCLSYVVGSCGEAYVVDPSTEVEVYEKIATARDWTIVGVFDTHLHADHLSGARELARRTGATLYLNPADTFDFDYEPLTDEQVFTLPCGTDLGVSVLHTPGHTEGSTIFRVGDDAVLTGDTLFVDGVGRPDLADRAEEFAHNLYASLHERVLCLGDATRVLPSHVGEDVHIRPGEIVTATVGDLRRDLRPLSLDEDDFVRWAAAAATDRPPNYVEIIHANMGRPRVGADELRDLELGPNRCSLPA